MSRHIKEAIRQTKLHPHNKDFRHTHHRPQSIHEIRLQKEQASKASRFRVTCSKRALDLELLDKDLKTDLADVNVAGAVEDISSESTEQKCLEVDKENKDDGKFKCDKDICKIDKSSVFNPTTKVLCSKNTHILPKHGASEGDKSSSDKENKVICMYDVENEEEDDLLNEKIQVSSFLSSSKAKIYLL